MPIDTLHPDYQHHLDAWNKLRDVVQGEDAVKEKGASYLPRLSDQSDTEYKSYRDRAMFFDTASKTVEGLVGMVTRKPMSIEGYPENAEVPLDSVGREGESLDGIASQTLEEILAMGRVGLYVDAGENENAAPYISVYYAESIINWKTELIEGRELLTLVVLRELVTEDGEDEYEHEPKEYYRVLRLSEGEAEGSRVYSVTLYEKVTVKSGNEFTDEFHERSSVVPVKRGGRRFEEIPFTFAGTRGIVCECAKSPILDLVNVNLSHYRTSADLEHGRHFTALPTAYMTGVTSDRDKGTGRRIGSSSVWELENPQAKVGFLEFTGQGLGHLSTALEQKEKIMAVLGARLLEQQKASQEAAETVRLRHAGERSVLSKVAGAAQDALTTAMRWAADWLNVTGADAITVSFDVDFDTLSLDPQMIDKLFAMLESDRFSFESFFAMFKQANMYPEGWTMENELEAIAQNDQLLGRPSGEEIIVEEEGIIPKPEEDDAEDDA